MNNQGENNIKLGVFVLTGLFVLILSFYLIGKNRNLFGSGFTLRVRFQNLNGLMEGGNVLYAGIQAGTVDEINIINDTTMEVTLLMDKKFKPYIRKNALAVIGTEGLMGEKVVNISAVNKKAALIENGDQLAVKRVIGTDEMLQTLSQTNNNFAVVSGALKTTVAKINDSKIWDVLNDSSTASNIRASLNNITKTTANAREMTRNLDQLITQTKRGKGAAGLLLSDTGFAADLKTTMVHVKATSTEVNRLAVQLNQVVQNVNADNGVLKLLNDTSAAANVRKSLENIQKGTDGFNQNMEALKHNFLLRGYFKKQEKLQKARQ
ncbi:MlaD family protein [Mucilaginibacter straminoryzae]|nr:MlaD family protein [Mucilaginibacter straminoryzae]